MSVLGKRIKLLREENSLTQSELAKALNEQFDLKIDRVMVSKWETGFQTPVMNTIVCLAKFFDVSIDYLNGIKNENEDDSGMYTLNRIKQLLKEQNKKQKDLTDYLGLSKNTFTNWNLGLSSSYKQRIDKIAEFLGVSTDYLLGKTDTKKVAPPVQTDEERQLVKEILDVARDLPDDALAKLLDYVDLLKAKQDQEKR